MGALQGEGGWRVCWTCPPGLRVSHYWDVLFLPLFSLCYAMRVSEVRRVPSYLWRLPHHASSGAQRTPPPQGPQFPSFPGPRPPVIPPHHPCPPPPTAAGALAPSRSALRNSQHCEEKASPCPLPRFPSYRVRTFTQHTPPPFSPVAPRVPCITARPSLVGTWAPKIRCSGAEVGSASCPVQVPLVEWGEEGGGRERERELVDVYMNLRGPQISTLSGL